MSTPEPVAETAEPVAEPVAETVVPARPRSSYSMGSGANMARSLLVILGLVVVLIAIVPRVSHVRQPAVDAVSVAADAASQSGLPFEAPVGLPDGWSATNARYTATTDGLLTWQGGWSTPSGGYVAIRQTKTASPNWLKDATNDGEPQSTVQVAGTTWQKYYDATHKRTSLADIPSGAAATTSIATVVTATAEDSEVTTFVTALQPAHAS